MSFLKNCDECNMTCCPNYNPYRLPKDFAKQKARECFEKIREDFIAEMKETEKEKSIKLNSFEELFEERVEILEQKVKYLEEILESEIDSYQHHICDLEDEEVQE